MKNRKGFTLVELLAVIVIMGVLITIAIPSSLTISKKIKNNMWQSKLNNIVVAAELWVDDNQKDCKTIENKKVSDLVNSGYLKADDNTGKVVNTSNNEDITDSKLVDLDIYSSEVCKTIYKKAYNNYINKVSAVLEENLEELKFNGWSAGSGADFSICSTYSEICDEDYLEKVGLPGDFNNYSVFLNEDDTFSFYYTFTRNYKFYDIDAPEECLPGDYCQDYEFSFLSTEENKMKEDRSAMTSFTDEYAVEYKYHSNSCGLSYDEGNKQFSYGGIDVPSSCKIYVEKVS